MPYASSEDTPYLMEKWIQFFNSQLNSSKDDESALEEINEIVFKKES